MLLFEQQQHNLRTHSTLSPLWCRVAFAGHNEIAHKCKQLNKEKLFAAPSGEPIQFALRFDGILKMYLLMIYWKTHQLAAPLGIVNGTTVGNHWN